MSLEIQQNIRAATVEDSQNLAMLSGRAFLGYPFDYVFTMDGMREAIQNGEQRYVMTNSENQIIGSAVLGINESKMTEIMRVMIEPTLRKNGAATRITLELALKAINLGKYSWSDVRSDQIGMQRAALGAGLRAISLEQGKHVVYNHIIGNGVDTGPARETMVHMTTLPFDELQLKDNVANLPIQIRNQLSESLSKSLNPSPKDEDLARSVLPSATETRNRILVGLKLIRQKIDDIAVINSDILKIKLDDTETIVVLPDASAFIQNGNQLDRTINLLNEVGIQVVTYYRNIQDLGQNNLILSGLEASSVRPWVDNDNKTIVWQIAWRKTFNNYESCLHTISLDRIVERQIMKIIRIIG